MLREPNSVWTISKILNSWLGQLLLVSVLYVGTRAIPYGADCWKLSRYFVSNLQRQTDLKYEAVRPKIMREIFPSWLNACVGSRLFSASSGAEQ